MELERYNEKHIRVADIHGTAELRTEPLILRRYKPDDAADLYQLSFHIGKATASAYSLFNVARKAFTPGR